MDDKWKMFFLLMILILITLSLGILMFPKRRFSVIACDVGQGDAVLITYGSTQILSDGGPDSSVLNCLSENMAFWDREIELVLISHPQVDHFGGIIDVANRYKIKTIMTTGLDSSSQEWEVLENAVGGNGVKVMNVRGGEKYGLGLIHLDVLWPTETYISANSAGITNREVNVLGMYTSEEDPNESSLVTLISYSDFDVLLTGDISPEVSDILSEKMNNDGRYGDIEVLKVPHHGSKNGMTGEFLDVVHPDTAIISVGKNNRYGHPSVEIINMLEDRDINILRTDETGDINLDSDLSANQ